MSFLEVLGLVIIVFIAIYALIDRVCKVFEGKIVVEALGILGKNDFEDVKAKLLTDIIHKLKTQNGIKNGENGGKI